MGGVPVLGMRKSVQAQENNGDMRGVVLIFVRCFSGIEGRAVGGGVAVRIHEA